MKDMLKWPLIIAAIVTILRVIVERAGVPDSVSNVFSVVALHLLIAPLYFAIRIGLSSPPRPYVMQIKLVASYVILTRAMIIPTYWLAYILGWHQRRFGGLSPDTAPFTAYITIPFATAAMWIVASVIIGGAFGCIVIALMSRVYDGATPKEVR
jgi:hypothetical protein